MEEFPHIGALHQVARHIKILNEDPELESINLPMTFEGTVKLHGCNCGISFFEGEVAPQSRTRTLSPTDDHYGFAKFVEARKGVFSNIAQSLRDHYQEIGESPLTVFGEYIGPGIQRKTAITKLSAKQFVIFAAFANDAYKDQLKFLSDPKSEIYNVNDVQKYEVTIDFADRQSFEDAVEHISRKTKEVEDQCPWAKQFEVEGVGEGIVWKPTGGYQGDSRFYFKSKGMKHQGGKEAKIKIAIDPEVLKSINDFVDFSCTNSRLQQGLEAIKEKGLELEMKNMGTFLRWVGDDIQRECALELETSSLGWKEVSKPVTIKARDWYKDAVTQWGG